METREYRTTDKVSWGDGPWQSEPDKAQWRDEETGLPCLIVRGPSGALCGYVGVSPRHPKHGADYDDLADVEVHGGLTFGAACAHGGDESRGVCHVPGAGEPDDVWWFGFDCAHCWDISPAYIALGRDFKEPGARYRDWSYVRREVRQLAQQIAALAVA